jgi:hypothetical protein
MAMIPKLTSNHYSEKPLSQAPHKRSKCEVMLSAFFSNKCNEFDEDTAQGQEND